MIIQQDFTKCNRCNESLPEDFLIGHDTAIGIEQICNQCYCEIEGE